MGALQSSVHSVSWIPKEGSLGGPSGFISLSPLVPFHTSLEFSWFLITPATVDGQAVPSRARYQHHCEGLPYVHYSPKAESKVYLHANSRAEKAQMMLFDCFQLSDPKQSVLVALILALLSQQRKPERACFNSLCLCLPFEVMRALKCIPATGRN